MIEDIQLRHPVSNDGPAMRQIAGNTQVLSVNSAYYYALMAKHFQSTCLVAENENGICGYVTGYHPPGQPNDLFIWQVGVARQFQGKGLAGRMLIALVHERQPAFIEATIAKDNQASIKLFRSIGRHFKANHFFSSEPFFNKDSLGSHEQPEYLMRVGPF